MPSPFEEPIKTDMRADAAVAIDQSGHDLVTELVPIELPPGRGAGRLKGDLQSTDGDGCRYCYYVRPRADEALPEWLANLAIAAHELPDVEVYVVVRAYSDLFEQTCRAAGAGLLVLNVDLQFEMVIDFDDVLPAAMEDAFKSEAARVRRELERKVDLQRVEIEARYGQVATLTRTMAPELADKYSENVERQYREWDDWSDGMSSQLDEAVARRDSDALARLAERIEAGPPVDADFEE